MRTPRALTAARVAVITAVTLVAVAAGYLETWSVRTDRPARRPPASTAEAFTGATAPASAPATPSAAPARAAAVAAVLAGPLAAAGLGGEVRAQVRDVATGTVLLDRASTVPVAPASTAKLLTAAAVLTTRGPAYRIPTSVVAGAGGTLVLVGQGDPTLSGAPAGQQPTYPGAARLADLAAAVTRAGLHPSRIVVDGGAFAGPAVSPDWAKEDVPSDYGAAVTAVMTDGGRATPSAPVRSAAPDLAAGAELAGLLGDPGLPVTRGSAPAGTAPLATVQSAPVSQLVAEMLTASDNVIAECLGRQVALAAHAPATFTGAAAAVRAAVRTLGVDPGAGLRDASGLAAADRVSPDALAGLLDVIGSRPSGPLGDVVAGLPVAAWSGSLADRYLTGSAHAAAGLVRAKTGTLTGVSALAGFVHDRGGRLLAFAFVADRTTSTPAAEAALDVAAAALAGCACS